MRTRFSRCCAFRGEAGATAQRSASLLQGRYGARQFSKEGCKTQEAGRAQGGRGWQGPGEAGECALRLC